MPEIVRKLASLKLTVVLLLALAVAMALASLYETRHGTEAAVRDYYASPWFAAILAAIGVNVLASLLVRLQARQTRAGFLIAHVAVLAVLVGSLITRVWGVHANVWLWPDRPRSDVDGEGWVLRLGTPDGSQRVEVPVSQNGPAFDPGERGLDVAGVRWTIEQFAADTIDEGERVVADANAPSPAIKVQFTHGEHEHEQWVLGGQGGQIAGLHLAFNRVTDPETLTRLLAPTSAPGRPKRGRLVVTAGGKEFVIDVDAGFDQPVPLGRTGYEIRPRLYLPHAQVQGREIQSATSRPVNPMIEFDLIDPAGRAGVHRLFARFPDRDFAAPHAGASASAPATQPVKFRYADATILGHQANRIDLLMDGAGKLHARFTDADGRISSRTVETGKPVATPWQQTRLTVVEVLLHARNERSLTPITPRPQNTMPAAFLFLQASGQGHRLWVRRGETYDVTIGGKRVQVGYLPDRIPLPFSIKLVKPIITNYPGTDRARTYESRVLVEDPRTDTKLERTISMNAPLKYGGYAFYQSSYQFDRNNKPTATMLSVADDPGEPVVYAGYVALLVGMIVMLVQKIRRYGRTRAPSG